MKITIKETGKIEILEVMDSNNIEWTQDILGNAGFNCWNKETEQYEMSQDDFDWWDEYIDNYNSSEKAIAELAEELGIEVADINLRIQEEMNCDMENEYQVIQSILEDIRSEHE